MQTLNKILKQIEDQKITITGWLLGFTTIFFVRLLLESLSSPSYSGLAPTDPYTVIHYFLYFTAVTTGTILIFGFFSRNYSYAVKFTLFGFTLIWLAPILDLLLSRGNGFRMMYLFDSGSHILYNLLTFFGNNLTFGATIGIRIGVAISILGIGYLIYIKNNSKFKTFLSMILLYVFVFLIFNLPAVVYTLTHIAKPNALGPEVVDYFNFLINNSNIHHNTLREGFSSVSSVRFLELGFDKLCSQILYLLSFIFALTIFYKIDKNKFKAVLKNSRIERITSYILLLLCGSGYAYLKGLSGEIYWIDFISLFCLIVSWFCLWMHAVHTNDVVDIEIDKISNKERPLTSQTVTIEEMTDTGHLWLVFALLGSWCVGFYAFFFSLIYISAYSTYSIYPLRLRRFPLISSFLISIAGLATILSGFYFISMNKNFRTFPIFLSLGIITMITLAINTKDLKDLEGDSRNGIMTIPTLFPKHGHKIVSILFGLSLLLVPLFLKMPTIFFFSVPCALLGYIYINKKPYSETPLFFIRFTFLTLVILNYLYLFISHGWKIVF